VRQSSRRAPLQPRIVMLTWQQSYAGNWVMTE
jgi:hypothetical protein